MLKIYLARYLSFSGMGCSESLSLSEVERLIKVLRLGFVKILGESNLNILEIFLRRFFKRDIYHVFLEEPKRFYEELIKIYGDGADFLLRALFTVLVREDLLKPLDIDEIMRLMKMDDKDFIKKLLDKLE